VQKRPRGGGGGGGGGGRVLSRLAVLAEPRRHLKRLQRARDWERGRKEGRKE